MKRKNDDMEATPPPEKKEPEDAPGEPEGGEQDGGDGEETNPDEEDEMADQDKMQEAYKSLLAEMDEGNVAPAAPAAPAAPTMAKSKTTTEGDGVVVDGDQLVEEMLKSTAANITAAVAPVAGRVDKLNGWTRRVVEQNHEMSKSLAAAQATLASQGETIAELKKAVMGGRRGFLSINEPIRGGQPNAVTPEEFKEQAHQFMAKSAMAVERTAALPNNAPGKIPAWVPSVVEAALNRGVSPLDVAELKPFVGAIRNITLS